MQGANGQGAMRSRVEEEGRERKDGEMDGGGEIHNAVNEGWGRREGDGPETWIRIHPTKRIQQSHRKKTLTDSLCHMALSEASCE